jgi:NAD(P)-dependent dehydrogenase (short-subunit alcohol dehydrogenase family)
MSGKLEGRAAIVTGASQGLGLEIARAFEREGARVLACARDIGPIANERGIDTAAADVSNEDDVKRLIDRALELFPQVHVLVNNAGIYGPKGPIEQIDWSEWVRAIQINLLGSVLMCRYLVPHMRKHRYGKIIQLSGGGATNPLPRISAYAASKAAVVRFAETLAEETREDRIDVNSIAPGPLNTRLLDEVLEAGPDAVGRDFYDRAVKQRSTGGAPLERGAALAVFLASAASDGITGKLLSAIWDPWEDLPKHAGDLKSDVYTLRRIVPKDRGFSWGDR